MRQESHQQDIADIDRDPVDAIVGEWRRERPDLDPTAKQVTGRIVRLAAQYQQAYADVFAPLGLNEGDYGVLAPLRRCGAPYELTPTELTRHRMITSGGMTVALDRLERKGFVERVRHPTDRRGYLVRLTDAGRAVVDEAMTQHARVEQQLVSALDDDEQTELVALLRKLLVPLD